MAWAIDHHYADVISEKYGLSIEDSCNKFDQDSPVCCLCNE